MLKKLLLGTAIAAALSFQAAALDMTEQVTQLDGKPLIGADGKAADISIGTIIKNSLLYTDMQTKPDTKNKRFWIAVKVGEAEQKKTDLVLTPAEITEIETSLKENQSILIYGQVSRMIDPTFKPPQN